MTFKRFTENWWFWVLCVSAVLFRGFLRHWDFTTWLPARIVCHYGWRAFTRVATEISTGGATDFFRVISARLPRAGPSAICSKIQFDRIQSVIESTVHGSA